MALALVVLSTVVPAIAEETISLALRYSQAADLEPVIAQLLAGVDGCRWSVDAATNQLQFTGPPQAQEMIRQLVMLLDQPPSSHAANRAQLRAYLYSGAQPAQAAIKLRNQFPPNADIRITADERAGQLLVWASPEMQAEIPRRLGALAANDRSGAALSQTTAVGGVTTRAVRLANSRIDSIEKVLRDMFGKRLTSQTAPTNTTGKTSYVLNAGQPTALELSFDQRQNQVLVRGAAAAVAQATHLIEVLDRPRPTDSTVTRIVPLGRADLSKVRQAVDAYRQESRSRLPQSGPAVDGGTSSAPDASSQRHSPKNSNVQPASYQEPLPGEPSPTTQDSSQPQTPNETETEDEATQRRIRELGSGVEVEALPDLDVIILRGNQRDVDEVIRIIREIERVSAENEPEILVHPLTNVGSEKLAAVIEQVRPKLLAGRHGEVSVTALVKPNSLLLIGWGDALKIVTDLIDKLDQPVAAQGQLRVFRLKFAPAATARTTIEQFFAQRKGLGAKIVITADVRTNSLVVQADPSDLEEVALLIERLDTDRGAATNDLRIFRLKNSLASDLAPVLEGALAGDNRVAPGTRAADARSAILRFLTIDASGQKVLQSGILADVKITPDPRTNTLLVSAPADSMELIGVLIEQLDGLPASVAQIKVFTIVNGDAAEMVLMLRSLLGVPAGGSAATQLAGAEGESSLAPLRFSVDTRTNTIVASGSAGDLNIVEAILLRLDEETGDQRKSEVYRLKNSPALNVAQAINDFLRNERTVQEAAPGAVSAFRKIESEVVVVPEVISNSLVVSATPRYFDEIHRLIEQLDAQPPQVLIQVLIAEVALNNTDEFGVELGLQDALLFDRSLLGNLVTIDTQTLVPGVGTVQNQQIVGATNAPGYDFNNQPLGNSGATSALANSHKIGSQGLSSFNLGRVNSELGFGGLVLSASSESLSVLLRALKETRKLNVLSRPQVMTLDNQSAFIQVGQRIPRIVSTSLTQFGQVNSIDLENVGLILGVTPRISPDGLVVMEIDAEKSAINTQIEIQVSNVDGQPIFSPSFDTTLAQTTVSASSGQTIILGGLITKSDSETHRRVPFLSRIPVVGFFFRYDEVIERRTELLIILTPHIVLNNEEAERLKQIEAARMSWCLADVNEIHGDIGVCDRGNCAHCDAETVIVYPDMNPRGMMNQPGTTPQMFPSGPPFFETPEIEFLPEPGPQSPDGTPSTSDPEMVVPRLGPAAAAPPASPTSTASADASTADPNAAAPNSVTPGTLPPGAGETHRGALPAYPVVTGPISSETISSGTAAPLMPGQTMPSTADRRGTTAPESRSKKNRPWWLRRRPSAQIIPESEPRQPIITSQNQPVRAGLGQ